jgi:hypothetical protein
MAMASDEKDRTRHARTMRRGRPPAAGPAGQMGFENLAGGAGAQGAKAGDRRTGRGSLASCRTGIRMGAWHWHGAWTAGEQQGSVPVRRACERAGGRGGR